MLNRSNKNNKKLSVIVFNTIFFVNLYGENLCTNQTTYCRDKKERI